MIRDSDETTSLSFRSVSTKPICGVLYEYTGRWLLDWYRGYVLVWLSAISWVHTCQPGLRDTPEFC